MFPMSTSNGSSVKLGNNPPCPLDYFDIFIIISPCHEVDVRYTPKKPEK